MDSLSPNAYVYRPLKKGDKGWDIYSLQTGLYIAHDGDFGPLTEQAVKGWQERQDLVVDGIAGIATQRSLCLSHIWTAQGKNQTPPGLMRGQVEKESGFQLGNHSAQRDDGSWDVGPCQRNTKYVSLEVGFNVPGSVQFLGSHLRQKHDEYKGFGKVTDERRLWELAAGSWNAPAWADRLARGLTISESQETWLSAYISRVCVYMKV